MINKNEKAKMPALSTSSVISGSLTDPKYLTHVLSSYLIPAIEAQRLNKGFFFLPV